MTSVLSILLISVMLVIFLIQARRSSPRTGFDDPEAYFLSKGSHSSAEYGISQIAYFLQMATIFPFFVFAVLGQWWMAVWNIIFFALGIFLFERCLTRFQRSAKETVSESATIHALIAKLHKSESLRVVSAFLTIAAFLGLAVFELTWGAHALRVLFGPDDHIYVFSIILLATYLIFFVWTGGQRATLKTDQFQLIFAYVGLHLFLGAFLFAVPNAIANSGAAAVFGSIALLNSYAIYRRLRNLKQDRSAVMIIINIIAISSLCFLTYQILASVHFKVANLAPFSISSIDYSTAFWSMLTFAILPIFYQFADLSNWQRLASLENQEKSASEGLRTFLVESPLSWLLPIGIGLVAVQIPVIKSAAEPWSAFLELVAAGNSGVSPVIGALLISGIIAVFLSTADGLITASGYTFAFDIYPPTRRIMDRSIMESDSGLRSKPTPEEAKRVVSVGRTFISIGFVIVVACYVAAYLHPKELGSNLIGIFLSFYGPMIALVPSIVSPIILGRKAPGAVALVSMVVAACSGVLLGVNALHATEVFWQWAAVPVTIALSWFIYLVGSKKV
jgi:Na+/proline symporter